MIFSRDTTALLSSMDYTEKPAKGVKGFLLWDVFNKEYTFRVYHKEGGFTDYDLCAEEIEVELTSNFNSLYDGDKPKLDFSSRALGKK